jgi:hypothetical protein
MRPLEWKPLSVVASRGQTGVSLECRACHRLLHRSLRVSAFAVTHSRCLRSCSVLGGFIKPPLLSFLTPTSVQQGSFALRALPRFIATASPAATVSSSADFPGSPVIGPTWLRRFLGRDEDGFSSCSTCPCHRAAPDHPAGVTDHFGQPVVCHAAFARRERARPPELISCRGHHWVHLRCGPVTRSPSRRWLGRSASSASFPPRMRPKLRRSLTLSSGGTASH